MSEIMTTQQESKILEDLLEHQHKSCIAVCCQKLCIN